MTSCNPGCTARPGMEDRVAHANDIFYLQLHLTRNCNLRCKHCYIESTRDETAKASAGGERRQELQPDEILAIIKQFDEFSRGLGFRGKMYFTGGEPLLDTHLIDYIRAASQLGIIPMILSNGTLIDTSKARALREAGTRIVQVSLDGMETTHEFLRGKGTFNLATRALDACHEAGLATIAMLTLSKLNAKELPEVMQHCLDHHVTSFAIGRLVPEGTGTQLWNQVLSPRELESAFKSIARTRASCSNKMEIGIHDPLWLGYIGARGARGCTAGKAGVCIIENGDVMACRRIDQAIGNIRETHLLDLWYSRAMNAYRHDDRFHGKCGTCNRNTTCGGCRAIARAVTGDTFGADPQCFRHKRGG